MFQRFSLLSGNTYENYIRNAFSPAGVNNVQEMTKALMSTNIVSANYIAQSNLVSGARISSTIQNVGSQTISAFNRGAEGTIHAVNQGTEATVNALSENTNQTVSAISSLKLTNMFGSLLTVGAIASATYVINKKVDKVISGIELLGNQFTEGMSLLASKIDLQNNSLNDIKDRLKKIQEVLESPVMTQAAEWRNIGLDRLSNELIPEANEAFQKAVEYDSVDPISNMMLGKIHLDGIRYDYNYFDPDKSLNYFQKSSRYSRSTMGKIPELKKIYIEAIYFSAIALLAKASTITKEQTSSFDENIERALTLVEDILITEPDYKQAQYLKAKFLVLLDKENEAKNYFDTLVKNDVNFLFMTFNDDDFIHHSALGKKILRDLEPFFRELTISKAKQFYELLKKMNEFNFEIPNNMQAWLNREHLIDYESAKKKINEIEFSNLLNPNSSLFNVFEISTYELSNIFNYRLKEFEVKVDLNIDRIFSYINEIDWEYADISSLKTISTNQTFGITNKETLLKSMYELVQREKKVKKLPVFMLTLEEIIQELEIIRQQSYQIRNALYNALGKKRDEIVNLPNEFKKYMDKKSNGMFLPAFFFILSIGFSIVFKTPLIFLVGVLISIFLFFEFKTRTNKLKSEFISSRKYEITKNCKNKLDKLLTELNVEKEFKDKILRDIK